MDPRSKDRIDITGEKFGRLLAIKFSHCAPAPLRKRYWLFKCDCGKDVVAIKDDVRKLEQISCGCYKTDQARKRSIEYFWSNVKKTKTCWNCTTSLMPNGYGQWLGDYAHRTVYKMREHFFHQNLDKSLGAFLPLEIRAV